MFVYLRGLLLDVFGALGDDERASNPMSNPISQRRSHALLAGMFGFIALQTGITCKPTHTARLSDLTVEVRGALRTFGFDPAVRGYDVPVLDRVVTIQARGRDIDARIEWSLGEATGVVGTGEPLELEVQLEPHLGSEADGIVLDLAAVRFINSAGLGCLVKTGMHLDRQGRRLALACPQRSVEATLRLVGLDSKLPLFKSVQEALDFVRHHSSQGR